MQFFVLELQKKIEIWRAGGYIGIYPETRNILNHIKSNGYLHKPQKEAFDRLATISGTETLFITSFK